MNKAIRMARVSAKGGFNLFWGIATSTIISAISVILIARLLSPPEYGIVAIALMAPNLITIFRDWGINSATIKYTAQYRSENKTANVKSILAAGLFFELVLGFSLSFISFLLSGFLATNIFQRPAIKPLIEIASFTIFTGALLTASQSAFTGYEKMELNSITMICQSALKTVLAPLLVILGFGTFGVILGTTIAFLIAGLISILILYLALYKKLHRLNDDKLEIVKTIKTMFKYGLPLSVSAILGGFLGQFYNFMIAIYCTNLMIGNYSAAVNFAALITFFSAPIATVLFPAFSKLNPEKETETLRIVFQSSIKYAALLVIPATAAIMVLSKPLVFTLFSEKYTHTPLFLTLCAISYLYTGLGSLTLGNFLNGQGKTKVTMKLTLITISIGLPLSIILIPRFGIAGLILATLVAGIPSLTTGLLWVKKHFGFTVDWASSTKIFLASATAAATTHIILSQLGSHHWIKLIIGGTIFLITYLTTTPLIRAVNQTDINNLREMLSDLGPLSHIFNLPLNIMEKLILTSQKT